MSIEKEATIEAMETLLGTAVQLWLKMAGEEYGIEGSEERIAMLVSRSFEIAVDVEGAETDRDAGADAIRETVFSSLPG